MPTCKLTKKTLSHLLLHAFCIHFLRIHHGYFFTSTISFRKYKRKVVIYLFNDDSSNSAFFMLNLAFANVKINLQCKGYKNILIRWDLTWCVFYVKKSCLREKTILKDFKRIIKSRNYLLSVNLSLKFWFSEAAVRRCVSK